jgi:hypothetical protein
LEKWKHILNDMNPTDIPISLPKISDLAESSIRWNGPHFLSDSMTSWPKPFVPPTEVDDEAMNEFKKLLGGIRFVNSWTNKPRLLVSSIRSIVEYTLRFWRTPVAWV